MSKLRIAVLGLLFGFLSLCAPATSNAQDRATLYSINKHKSGQLLFCMNFRSGVRLGYVPEPCDLSYGSMYVGDEMDWFQSSGAEGNRSVIKDLGFLNWDQTFTVPIVEPLPKLQPGEQRVIKIDASGADGADGAPGAPARNGDGTLQPVTVVKKSEVPVRPKHDGKLRVDPMFVKAIVGHTYVIHVVHDTADFYALFRVEEIERGSNCTISWRMIPEPTTEVVQDKK